MNWLEITAQISQVAGVVSVVFAAIAIRANTRLTQRQWNVDTFNLYFERHQKVVDNFPDNAFYNRLDPSKLPPRSPELTLAVLKYLYVISAVHYLAYQKYLADSIWNVWRADLEITLKCPLIYREWPDIKHEFAAFETYTAFLEGQFESAIAAEKSAATIQTTKKGDGNSTSSDLK